ncbi:MAG: ABC transporter permease, partial [Paracoccaceae bacterium]|nr:ABC transporter permease [Paracoccaceae bacterium]
MNVAEAQNSAQTLQNASLLQSEEYRERFTLLGLSLPAILAILIVVFLPIIWLSSLSLYNATAELSMENYARILESRLYRRTFVVTFQISISVTLICIILGYPLCYWLAKMPDRTAAILMVFVLVPFW